MQQLVPEIDVASSSLEKQALELSDNKKLMLGGLPIDVVSRAQTADQFLETARFRKANSLRPFFSTSANGQVVAECHRDGELRGLFKKADQIHADGMPMVMVSKLLFDTPLPERVATTDLFHDVARKAELAGLSFYILGADEASNRATVEKVRALYPDLKIVGSRNGYFSDDEEEEVIADINEAEPDFLWVGMGVPLEQKFVLRNLKKFRNVGVIKTAGGLFDFVSGKRSRAPRWMQRVGLEWLYRMGLEPRRLGPRYLLTNPLALRVLIQSR